MLDMIKTMPLSVFAVVMRKDGKILGVTRRNCQFLDKNTYFGLPGGKVNETDPSLEYAIHRELNEETGLIGHSPFIVHSSFYRSAFGNRNKYIATAFCFTSISGVLQNQPNEGILAWVPPSLLIKPPYGDYNKRVFDDMRIAYPVYANHKDVELVEIEI